MSYRSTIYTSFFLYNWGNTHELQWFFLSNLSTVFITEAMTMSSVHFIFPVSFYLFIDNLGNGQLIGSVFFHGSFCISLLYKLIADTVPSAVLILFFATLSASSMITEAMVSWLLPFLPSLCTYSILCTLETFSFFHDNWNNGQLIGFIFFTLFVPILFCVLWSQQWDLLFIGVVS